MLFRSSKMKLYDVEASAQDLVDSGQEDTPALPKPKFNDKFKSKFGNLKV